MLNKESKTLLEIRVYHLEINNPVYTIFNSGLPPCLIFLTNSKLLTFYKIY